MKKLLISFMFVSVLVGCSLSEQHASTQQGSNSQSIGWLDKECLAIRNPNFVIGDQFTVVDFSMPQQQFNVEIVSESPDEEQCAPLIDERKVINLDQGFTFYMVDGLPTDFDSGIALLKSDYVISNVNGYQTVDLNGDKKPDFLSQCFSSEGIHFTVNDGAVNGPALWASYYYLAYDLEANCP